MAPDSLPPVRIPTPVYDTAILGMLLGMLCAVVGLCSGIHSLTASGSVIFALSNALTWRAARCLLPESVDFGEMQMFRELAVVVAESKPAEQRQST